MNCIMLCQARTAPSVIIYLCDSTVKHYATVIATDPALWETVSK